ncbi:CRISPR-associated endonuclease Cas2 [Bacteroidetes/Chlorobi group bacterium ChocPot_Mid]|nr:MAG: CRISPR-associated endonuclease Cas2 [Bacteroidetes/Chlorobi group bacterium ChocPot_Mid]
MSDRVSAYRIMWVFTLFDLPVQTKKDRYEYSRFKKFLAKEGFEMFQFSVYIRHCASFESAEVYEMKIGKNLPEKGTVTTFTLTDKQFGRIKHYFGQSRADLPEIPQQLQMF